MSMRAYVARRLVERATANVEELAEIFRLLSDPTRLRILVTLVDGGEQCVHEICARVALSQPAVSHQLRTLRSARLVRSRRAGREVYYTLDDDHVVTLLSEGLRHAGEGGAA